MATSTSTTDLTRLSTIVGFAAPLSTAVSLTELAQDLRISRSALIRRLLAAGAEAEGLNLPIRA